MEQVLTHTAGFPFAPLGYPKMLDRDTAARGVRPVAARLGTREPPPVPPDGCGVGHRRARRAPHRPAVRRLPRARRSWSRSGSGSPARCRRTGSTTCSPCPSPSTARATTRRSTRGVRGTSPTRRCWPPASRATRSSAPLPTWRCSSRRWCTPGCGRPASSTRRPASDAREPPFGERLYGGSDEIANIGLFCMVERRGRRALDAAHRLAADVRQRRRAVPARRSWIPTPGTRSRSSRTATRWPATTTRRPGVNRSINIANLGNDLVP